MRSFDEDVKILFGAMSSAKADAIGVAGDIENHANELVQWMRNSVDNGWEDAGSAAQLEEYYLLLKQTGYHVDARIAEGSRYGDVEEIGQNTLSRVTRLIHRT